MESSPFVSFNDREFVIARERAVDGSVLAANMAAAPPTNISRLVKFAIRTLSPCCALFAHECHLASAEFVKTSLLKSRTQ
jgi:hypothetical protein